MNVFITGITGTLGRAFATHLRELGHQVSGVDHNEERLAAMRMWGFDVKLGDFADTDVFRDDPPDVLLHLAAYKHVDLCETNPSACVLNNVVKTFDLFHEARLCGTDILFMSTDKAVEPCSLYGYSKALMEQVALEWGGAVIRSGNILASNGSVLHVWEEAISKGEPLKITHKDMRRYFIAPENLARRAWNLYLKGEKLIIPKMDMDISLMELAEQVLARHGHTLETYPVEFTGLRPGEKLREKLR